MNTPGYPLTSAPSKRWAVGCTIAAGMVLTSLIQIVHAQSAPARDQAKANGDKGAKAEVVGMAPEKSANVVMLSPFLVNTEKDVGFMAANAGTATRLSLEMADVPAAYRTGDSTIDPATGAVVAAYSNGLLYPVYTKQPLNTVASPGYTLRFKQGWGKLRGKQMSFPLNIRNVLNRQEVIYQDDTVTPRPPNGDFALPYRVGVATKNAVYQEPIGAILTTTLKF